MLLFKIEKILIKFLASGLSANFDSVSGIKSLSVFAFLIFCTISSSVSVKLILEASDSSDLLIFLVPSFRLIILATSFVIIGSGNVKKSLQLKSLLNFTAISLHSSKCCF